MCRSVVAASGFDLCLKNAQNVVREWRYMFADGAPFDFTVCVHSKHCHFVGTVCCNANLYMTSSVPEAHKKGDKLGVKIFGQN